MYGELKDFNPQEPYYAASYRQIHSMPLAAFPAFVILILTASTIYLPP